MIWIECSLGEVAQVKGGKRLPKGEKFADVPTPFPYIRVTDLANFTVDTSDLKYLRPETQASIKRYTITTRDVYISIAGSIGMTGVIPPNLEGANLTENAAKIVINTPELNPRFLMYFLGSDSAQKEVRSQTVKNAQPKLALARIASLKVCIPPIHEQGHIVKILDLIQRAMEQQERLIVLTTELKSALLHQLFTRGLRGEPQKQTDIGPVPESWEVRRIGDICNLKSGGTPNRSKTEYWKGGHIPWVKTGEVDYCVINDTEEKITTAGLAHSSARLFPSGTLLMAMYGQGITRGKVAILGVEAATNQACVAIFPQDEVRTKFLYYLFEHKYEYIRNLGHGANQKNLSAEILKGVTVAYPRDKAEQDTVAKSLEWLDKRLSLIRRKQILLSDLFRTLLHQLMTAQIRVHDLELPDLETAAAA